MGRSTIYKVHSINLWDKRLQGKQANNLPNLIQLQLQITAGRCTHESTVKELYILLTITLSKCYGKVNNIKIINTAHKELKKDNDINLKKKCTLITCEKRNGNNTVIFSIQYKIFTDCKLNHVG